MAKSIKFFAMALFLAGISGCSWNLARPDWFAPGSTDYQQQRATIHDPYADNTAGPEVVGGRPREYQQPLPEAVRSTPPFSGL